MTERPVVAVTWEAGPPERAAIESELSGVAGVVFLEGDEGSDRAAALADADVIFCWSPSRELPEGRDLGRARFVQLLSAGADRVRFAELPPNARVAGNVDAYSEPIAEHVLAMTLALAKRLKAADRELAAGVWDHEAESSRLAGGVAAILGFGGIGRASARLLRCLGMRIRAINTSGETTEAVESCGTLADLEPVLRAADVVVVSLPLTRETRGLIGSRQLAWMGPDAILVNVARGAIVDEDALYRHLLDHPGFGAAVDAWWDEPGLGGTFAPGHPFPALPNFVGSPHNSSAVPGVMITAASRGAGNIRRFLAGEPVRGLLDPSDYV